MEFCSDTLWDLIGVAVRRPILTGLLIAAALLLMTGVGVQLTHSGRILPGTTVAGIDLGGLALAPARGRLEAGSARPLLIGRRSIDPQQAGLTWDLDATLVRAQASGRTGPLFGLGSTLSGLIDERRVEPVLRGRRGRQRRLVSSLADGLDRASDPGGFRVNPATLRGVVEGPRDGRRVRQAALGARLRSAAVSESRSVEVPLKTVPAPEIKQIVAVAQAAERYLRTPLSLDGPRRIQIKPSRLAPVLAMRQPGRSKEVRLSVDREALIGVLERVTSRLVRPARPPEFGSPRQTVRLEEQGDVQWRPREVDIGIRPGVEGRSIDLDATARAVDEAVRTGSHSAPIARARERPAISRDEARRVDSVIGTFTTSYEPGQPRVGNIRRMAREVDGAVIPKGGQFSLNGVAGPRTRERGYVPAPFIADGKIVPEVGGGVSQFSTTMYNAAYFAGLQLDTSQSHSLYIDRYPPGREATLDFDSIDLRWTNDTAAPVVVQTSSTATSVTVTLLGDNDNRRVRAEAGERRPAPGADFEITVTREISYAGGRTVRQPRTTRYERPAEG